ncbi:hypothetical protein GCM10017786_07840 [Amycolatopsis deserti]|uniref:2-hydroxyhepta-2,4-diene-1,7-dioate isomerase n=1 Tax=Amycolatopsis deserti TaxID=185696 RepID=A0ABQ3IG94_9PSEU|nr:fumarylacetoacetate hydrolase family protein [Amycolatopsis deserti]GHE80210.1 hypothetical protein GCM10017786_07840 [Amycolatopsis deserti]
MRWATFATETGERVGAVDGGTIHALPPGETLLDHLRKGTLPATLDEAAGRSTDTVALNDVRLLAPIPRPPSMRDSLCYLQHMRNAMAARGVTEDLPDIWYDIPAFYFAGPASVVGPYDDVTIAPGSTWFDFELEIAAVIGGTGRDLAPHQAQELIAGYTLYCDWSARDLQALDRGLGIGQAKGKDAGTTLGPFLVTPDELPDHAFDSPFDIEVKASVNGVLVGSGTTGKMDWTYGEVLSYASRGIPLEPGDVIATGTIPTCTLLEHFNALEPDAPTFPGWLAPGDVVELTAEGIGTTRQRVVAGADPWPLAPRPRA